MHTATHPQAMYLDYVNNFISVDRFAEYYEISRAEALALITEQRAINHRNGQHTDKDTGIVFTNWHTFDVYYQLMHKNSNAREDLSNRRYLNVQVVKRAFNAYYKYDGAAVSPVYDWQQIADVLGMSLGIISQ